MKMKQQLTIVFLLCSLLGRAQAVPGYLGKRLTVGYGIDLWPSVSPTATGDAGLNHSHSLNLEYGIRNRTNFCASFRYFKTGLAGVGELDYAGQVVTYNPLHKNPMQLNSYDIGLAFKFFHKGYFAPVGKYRKLGLQMMINKVKYENTRFLYRDPAEKYFTVGTGEISSFNMAVTYELGVERALSDKLTFDTGIRFAVVPGPIFQVLGDFWVDDGYGYDSYASFASKVDKNTRDRLFLHELISVHLGIGFLAY
jgi:hypothetical protein